MIKWGRSALLGACVALMSCSATNSVDIYQLAEPELDALLAAQLQKQSKRLQLAGLPATISQLTVHSQIEADGVYVELASQLQVGLALLELPVSLQLAMLAEPYYDESVHGIRLRNFRLVRADIQAAGYSGRMKPLSNALQQNIAAELERQPIFVLDPNKPTQRILMSMPLQLNLEKDQLVIRPAFSSPR